MNPYSANEQLAQLLKSINGDTMLVVLDDALCTPLLNAPSAEPKDASNLRAWMLTILQREFIDPEAWCGRLPPNREPPREPPTDEGRPPTPAEPTGAGKRTPVHKSTGTLIAEWTSKGQALRLVAQGKHTAGYEDSYVLEKYTNDALGAGCWTRIDGWEAGRGAADERTSLLTGGIKELAAQLARLREQLPALGVKNEPPKYGLP